MKIAKKRRYDLDWLRVIVFGILIFYHVGMYFVPWDWHIKHETSFAWLEWPMIFVNQWRLPILFIISGMGTRYALSYRSDSLFRMERLKRLGIPLLVGIAIVVPPQIYIERVLHNEFVGTYTNFYFSECFRGIYPEGNLSWHHLWFLPYLLLFSILLSPLFIYLRDHPKSSSMLIGKKMLSKKYGIYLFIVPLVGIEIFVEPFFPVTHALFDDYYTILFHATLFLLGYVFISLTDEFWRSIDRLKQTSFLIGIIAFAIYYIVRTQFTDSLFIHIIEASIKLINMWAWIIVLFGIASSHLNRPSKYLAYCNEAVYPFYILHQTVQVILCYVFIQLQLNSSLTFIVLSLGTFFFTWLLYECLIRRIKFLRPFFGLKNKTLQYKNSMHTNSALVS